MIYRYVFQKIGDVLKQGNEDYKTMATGSSCCWKLENLKTTNKQPSSPLGERNDDDTAYCISIVAIIAATRDGGLNYGNRQQLLLQTEKLGNDDRTAQFSSYCISIAVIIAATRQKGLKCGNRQKLLLQTEKLGNDDRTAQSSTYCISIAAIIAASRQRGLKYGNRQQLLLRTG